MDKISIKSILEEMKVDEERTFPAERYRTVAVTCSDYGFSSGRRYKVSKDWERREVKVLRVS